MVNENVRKFKLETYDERKRSAEISNSKTSGCKRECIHMVRWYLGQPTDK